MTRLPKFRYTVDVELTPGQRTRILQTNSWSRAAETCNFWDERCNSWMIDWQKATPLEKADEKLRLLSEQVDSRYVAAFAILDYAELRAVFKLKAIEARLRIPGTM